MLLQNTTDVVLLLLYFPIPPVYIFHVSDISPELPPLISGAACDALVVKVEDKVMI